MSARITAEMIEAAERWWACPEAVRWLRDQPRTIADLVAHDRDWAEWAALLHPALPDAVREELQAAGCGRSWWRDGKLHRDDGPAIEWPSGTRQWRRDGVPHRDDGPAIEWADGRREWLRDGKLHRDDGPAVERPDGMREWWRDGKRLKP